VSWVPRAVDALFKRRLKGRVLPLSLLPPVAGSQNTGSQAGSGELLWPGGYMYETLGCVVYC